MALGWCGGVGPGPGIGSLELSDSPPELGRLDMPRSETDWGGSTCSLPAGTIVVRAASPTGREHFRGSCR
jgi:hypothetical protein